MGYGAITLAIPFAIGGLIIGTFLISEAFIRIVLPLSLPGTNETFKAPLPLSATPIFGVQGTVAGTTGSDAGEGGPEPTVLLAITVQV